MMGTLTTLKHEPFQSIFRPDFEVVEERQGRVRLYPHTAQLPLLHRALDPLTSPAKLSMTRN